MDARLFALTTGGQDSPRPAFIALVIVALAWGGAFTAGKIAVRELSPYMVAALRFALASVCLIVILWRAEGLAGKLRRDNFGWAFALGLFGVFGYNALLFAGLKLSTAVNGSLIAGANPMATVLLSAALLREPLSGRKVAGVAVSFCGVVLVVSKGHLATVVGLEFNRGDLLLLGSLLCFALNSVTAKRAMRVLTPLSATTFSCVIGGIALVPWAAADYSAGRFGHPTWETWAAIGYLGLFASVVGYVLWFYGVRQIGPSRASMFTNLVPIFGAGIAAVAGEAILLAQIAGAALVLSGVYLASTQRSAPPPARVDTPVARS